MDGRVEPHSTDADLEGLDESQRAELHAYEGGGPSDGLVLTDLARDRGEDFIEDEQPNELMPQEVDTLGMTIVTPEELGDDDTEVKDDER